MLRSNEKVINAYFYPTRVVFLDDHQAFLDSIPLALEANVAYQTFSDPKQVIDYINAHTQYHPLCEEDTLCTSGDLSYHYKFDAQSILDKTQNNQPSSESSVLITDYAIPGSHYNGLDVCNAIDNPCVKKVLLTGVADEHIAIEALNNKVIDYYLKKNTQDILPQINELIQRYQRAYFSDMTRVLRESLITSYPLIDDPSIKGFFYAILEQKNITQYHLRCQSNSVSLDFLMLDEQGDRYRLLILDPEDQSNHLELATDVGAPKELLEALKRYDKVPLFPSLDGFYHPDFHADWQKYLHCAKKIAGAKPYLATFIREADIQYMPTERFLAPVSLE